jgi:AraC family transcriptional regulator, exoenzyme S synthesis regulatory protein ExsA
MTNTNLISKSNIFFSCTETEYRTIENNVSDHVVIYIYSGSLVVTNAAGTYTIKPGETALFYRNMLAKFVKNPSEKLPFKSIAIAFSPSFLNKYYLSNEVSNDFKPISQIQKIKNHPLLTSLFNSILPYYEIEENTIPTSLSDIKLHEAMTILRTVDMKVDNLFANFAELGKLDLADYMEKNYSFNITMDRFAYLTGRSLATFKRDFQKAFNMTPQKWLLEKRLKEAHYQIIEKSKKPSDVYLEVGFENLSHFSRSFKQFFGYNPSKIEVSY